MGEDVKKFLAMTDDELHEIVDMFDGRELGHLSPEVRKVVFMMLAKVRGALGISGLGDLAYRDATIRKRSGDTLASVIYRSVMSAFPGQPEEIREMSWILAEGYPCRVRAGDLWVVFEDQSELMLSPKTGFAMLQNATRYRGPTVVPGGREVVG